MECPKCGRAVEAGAFICPGCEYILDTSFLGEDITDDERDKRAKAAAPSISSHKPVKTIEKPVDFGEDAIILGNGQGDYSDFSSKDAGMTREVTHARFYIGGNTAAILHVDSVPEIAPGLIEHSLKMSPFERHVLGFINGKRSIGRIQKKSAMEDSEFKTSVAMLADKGIIRLRTTKKKKRTDGGPSSLASRSEVSRVAPSPSSSPSTEQRSGSGERAAPADRTVVASFEQISAEHRQSALSAHGSAALAAAALDANVDDAVSSVRRTNVSEPTIVKSADAKKNVGTAGFASVRIQEQEAAPPVIIDDAVPDDWGEGEANNNISSVFARATPAPPANKARPPSLVDAPAVTAEAVDAVDAVGADRSAAVGAERSAAVGAERSAAVGAERSAAVDVERAARALEALARDEVKPPPIPLDETGEFISPVLPKPAKAAKAVKAALTNVATRASADPDVAEVVDAPAPALQVHVDSELPEQDEFIAPGGEDDFLTRARSKENPILKAAAAADAEAAEQSKAAANQATGPVVRARTTAPPTGDLPPFSVDENDVEDDVPAALRDPTGLGDLRPIQMRGGEPVDPNEDDEAAEEEDAPEERTAIRPATAEAADDDELPDVDRTAGIPAHPYTDDVPTGPLPDDAAAADDADQDEIDADDDDEAFDVEMRTAHLDLNSANTASLPAKSIAEDLPQEIMDLPHDALSPLPSRKYPAPAPPPLPAPPPIPQAIPQVARPSLPGQNYVPPPAVRPPALPGQAPGMPGASHRAPTTAAPPAIPSAMGMRPPTQTVNKGGLAVAARTSAGSTVPFEQGRKAEKIFEQALKDHAEGRISSARMNAKLAAMYDPSIETYRAFLADLDAMGANAKPPGGGKPKELTLFEQASDAEGRGDFEMAVDLLEEAVSINPKAAALRNRLGVVMSIRLKRHNEALEQLRIAIELEPGNIVYMNNFSKVTALLDSQLEKGPEDKKGKRAKQPEKVDIKKMRPKMF